MQVIPGHFSDLHTTESTFGPPRHLGSQLRVPAIRLVLLAGHPLMKLGWRACRGELVFDGVTSCRRTVTEYIGDPRWPDGFKDQFDVVDVEQIAPETLMPATYEFEGITQPPAAWTDWAVRASSFWLEAPDDGEVAFPPFANSGAINVD